MKGKWSLDEGSIIVARGPDSAASFEMDAFNNRKTRPHSESTPNSMAETEHNLIQERQRAFLGSIRVPLHLLHHESLPDNPRHLDEKNVARLLKVYELEGCLRLDSEHHVPVLAPSGLQLPTNVCELPLITTVRFQYLHGQHRLEAAKRFLSTPEKWWVVDVYAKGSPPMIAYSLFCLHRSTRYLRGAEIGTARRTVKCVTILRW